MAKSSAALARALSIVVLFAAHHSNAIAQNELFDPPPNQTSLGPADDEVFPPDQPPNSPPVNPEVGAAVALRGHTALVGMPGFDHNREIGRVAVFTRDANGAWEREGSIDAPAGSLPGLRFGVRLALDRDIALVGSPDRVFVYERHHRAWTFQQELKARGSEILDGALGVEDESLLIGASAEGKPGVVHVYERNRHRDWHRNQDLHAFQPSEGDAFGEALAIARGTLVVGAGGYKDGQGAAFVYQHLRHFYWPGVRLEASDAAAGATFGSTVDTNGELIAVGAPGANRRPSFGCAAGDASGQAYVFGRHRFRWVQEQLVVHPDSDCISSWALRVAISHDYFAASTFNSIQFGGDGTTVFPRIDGQYQQRYVALTTVGIFEIALEDDTLVVGNAIERSQFPIGEADVFEMGPPPAQSAP